MTVEIEEEEYKSKFDKLEDALKALGYVKIRYSLKAMVRATLEKQKDFGMYDSRTIRAENFLEINVIVSNESFTWLHEQVFEEWPDNELYEELVEKGVIKDEI